MFDPQFTLNKDSVSDNDSETAEQRRSRTDLLACEVLHANVSSVVQGISPGTTRRRTRQRGTRTCGTAGSWVKGKALLTAWATSPSRKIASCWTIEGLSNNRK